jgi:hypothetical protein
MELYDLLTQAGIMALLSLVVSVVPMVMGIAYAIRPTEARLALMRPLSLVGLFAGLGGFSLGLINLLRGISLSVPSVRYDHVAMGASESLVVLFVAFGSLTVGWLCVAFGMTRQA